MVSTTMQIVEAISERTGRDPIDLPPIGKTINTDALDNLMKDTSAKQTVKFEYMNFEVILQNGSLVLQEL